MLGVPRKQIGENPRKHSEILRKLGRTQGSIKEKLMESFWRQFLENVGLVENLEKGIYQKGVYQKKHQFLGRELEDS